jgi:hypothetical protein
MEQPLALIPSRSRWVALLGMLLLPACVAVAAGLPVAVVESVQGKVAGVEFMDYVSSGTVIKLGPKDSIVLGYVSSCWRETITGGTVIVVEAQSVVQGGRVERRRVACDAKRLQLGPREATQSAATVYRSVPRDPSVQERPLVLHGRSPVIDVGGRRGSLVIERLDAAGERIERLVDESVLLRGRFLDLSGTRTVLTPGGRYGARLGDSEVEFTIAADAQPGATPVVGRLLRLD